MASLLTIRERKARWKELEKLITTYNKRHKLDSFQFSLPNKELVFKGIVKIFYVRPDCCVQSKCLRVDSQTSSAEIVAKTMEKFNINEDPTNYAIYHVNTASKCERLVGDSEIPLTFLLFYNEKDQEDLRLELKQQTVLSTTEKRKTMAPPATPQKRKKNKEIIVPKDPVTDYGIAQLEERAEGEMTLLSKEADKVTEAAKDLVNVVARNGSPRYNLPSRDYLWQYLRPQAAKIIVHVKQLVVQATETSNRHCHHQSCLKFVTYHVDVITKNAKEVVLTAKGIGGVAEMEEMSREESVHKLIVEAEALCDAVSKSRQIIYMVLVSGLLTSTLPTWTNDNPLKSNTALEGSITVCRALNFSIAAANLLLLEAVCERQKEMFADLAGNVISSAQIAVETVQNYADISFLSRYPLKNRLNDVQKLVERSTTDLYRHVKLASSIWAPEGSSADMLLASFGVVISAVYYTIAAQCASALHNAALTGWDLLRHPWVMASFKEEVPDEGIDFASTSLTTVNEVMSEAETREEEAAEEARSVGNDTSGFASSEHLLNDTVTLTIPGITEKEQLSREGGSIDVLGASNASMLDGDERDNEFLDETDYDGFDDKPTKHSRSSSKQGSRATSRRPSQDIRKTNSKSGIAEEPTEHEVRQSTSSQHSLHTDNNIEEEENKTTDTAASQRVTSFEIATRSSSGNRSKTASQSSSTRNLQDQVNRLVVTEEPNEDMRRRHLVDFVSESEGSPRQDIGGSNHWPPQQEVSASTEPLKQHILSGIENENFYQRGTQSPSQPQRRVLDARILMDSPRIGKRGMYGTHGDRRIKKSPVVHSTKMSRALSAAEGVGTNLEMLKQACIVNKAISKVVEGLLFSITQKVTSLELASQKQIESRYQSIVRLISDAARQITEEVGGMELALVATENQELRDSIHRQATPILLAIREATAAAAMATGPWSSESAVSGLVSAVHHVKDLCFQMVSAALKATSAYTQLVDSLGPMPKADQEGNSRQSKRTSFQSQSSRGTPSSAFVAGTRDSHGSRRYKTAPMLMEERDDEGLVFMDTPGVRDGYASLHRNKGDMPVVKGGTLSRLIQRLTYHKIVDTDFTDCFLLTFHSFTSPHKLMDALIIRYNIESPGGLTAEEESQLYSEAVVPIRLRVCHVLRTWISKQFDDFLDTELAERLEKFTDVISRSLPSCAKHLRTAFRRQQVHGPELPRPRLSAKAQLPRRVPSEAINSVNILGVDPLELARQLTIIDWDVFKRIKPQECMGCCWNSAERQHLAVNIMDMIDAANDLSLWISGTIVITNSAELRGQYITYFIKTAKKSYKLKNYNAVFTIITALTSAAVYRLEASWEHVPDAAKTTFGQLYQFTADEDNYAAYRQELNLVVQQPVVPFLGIYLSDLTVTEESSPDFLPGQPHLINFHKRRMYARTIRHIQRYQQVAYNLTEVKTIHDFLKSLEPPVDEKDLYHCSVTAEPKRKS